MIVDVLAIAVGALIALFGFIGMFNPSGLKRVAREWTTGPRFYLVSAFRFAIAALFWLAAPGSRSPIAMYIMAAAALIAGVLTVALPARAVGAMVAWLLAMPDGAVRFWCWFPVAVGAFIIYVVV